MQTYSYILWICSRNTAQKQWDETLVLVLGGVARILRSFFPFLRILNNFWSGRFTFKSFCIMHFIVFSFSFHFLYLFISTTNIRSCFVSAGWESLLLFVKNSILNGSKEVALAAINCLQTTVLSHSLKVIIKLTDLELLFYM